MNCKAKQVKEKYLFNAVRTICVKTTNRISYNMGITAQKVKRETYIHKALRKDVTRCNYQA